MEGKTFKLVSRNIASSQRLERIVDCLKSEKPDLLLLQEVTLTTAQLQATVKQLQYNCEANIDPDNPSTPGTAIVWRLDLPVTQVISLVTCQLQSVTIGRQSVYNIYAPSGSENRRERTHLFNREIFPNLLQHQNLGLQPILAGDWNCLTDVRDTTCNFKDKYSVDLKALIKSFKYQDAFRVLHPNTVEFTFHRQSCAPSRLDRVYLPTHLITKLHTVSHHPGLADHWAVNVLLDLEVTKLELPPRRPRGHWKLNTSILNHESFLPQFSTLFNQLEEEIPEFEDVADWWDGFAKPASISFCQSFSQSLAKQKKTFKAYLLALLRISTNREKWELVAQTKEKLNYLIKNEAFGLIVRSRDNQNAEEEDASLYHLNKVQNNNLEKLKVVQQTGGRGFRKGAAMEVTTDPKRIQEETVAFYDALLNGRQNEQLEDTGQQFQANDEYLEEFLSNLSQLSLASQENIVKPLCTEEVEVVLKACANGKSPGLDGLCYEFYKKTWKVIGSTFTRVLQAQLDRVGLMESSKKGATRLIPKVETVPDVSELRPITLLQVDYRLLSGCLAVRLHSVITEVVDMGQLGTGGRNILTGVYNILSSIDYVNKFNLKAFLASWDALKAYDRASTVFLDKVTERMAFPQVFRSWLQMLHHGATTRLLLPTGLSPEISVSFSFRQGDCIAGDLYCITQEPLLRMLRKKLDGLPISNFRQLDEDYMDDIQFLSSNEQDLVTFDMVVQQFGRMSGFLLSRDHKSKVMGLGQWQDKNDWPLTWLKSVSELKVLGFIICPRFTDTLQRSWEVVYRGFERTVFSWENRALSTLQQRVSVLQKFALSKLWYVAQVLPLPNPVAKKIESRLSSFIFKGRPERLKLTELENTQGQGGLGLTCIVTKAGCLMLRQSLRILSRPEETCFQHIGYWLGHHLVEAFPELVQLGPSVQVLHRKFLLHTTMAELLEEGLSRAEYEPGKLGYTTTKAIYKGRIADVLMSPKVEEKFPDVDFPKVVYPRMAFRILEPDSKDVLFAIVHGLIHNKEQMFLQGRAQDPYCQVQECQGKVQDLEHLFCSCTLVVDAWDWLRLRVLEILPGDSGMAISNKEFLLLQFPASTMDQECVWLLGSFFNEVKATVCGKKRKLGAAVLAGKLRSKLYRLRGRAVVQPRLFNI